MKSIQESIKNVKHLFQGCIDKLKGGDKRRSAAKIAISYGNGGQTFAEKELGISRNTVRKGIQEITSGEIIHDRFNDRGRKKSTVKLPELEKHISEIMDGQSQADPKFQTDRLYTNLTCSALRKILIEKYGYFDDELPTERTLNNLLNEMKYTLKTVKKTLPKQKIKETDAIFANLSYIHEEANQNPNVVRLSIDTKDRVKIGKFSRGGKSRVEVKALDHDFADETVTPFGIMDVKEKTVDISLSDTKVTADFMADRLDEYWRIKGYSNSGKSLLLNADNGSENSSRRTQFVKRMVEFSAKHNTEVTLAYYPPYHSKYNPIERVWGVLEQHWNGSLLDTKEAVEKHIQTMTYAGNHACVSVITQAYETGVRVSADEMEIYEDALERATGLEKWFVKISPKKSMTVVEFMNSFD